MFEDSFSYFLRRTHHRPRDLQTLAYNAIFHNTEMNNNLIDLYDSLFDTLKSIIIKNSFRNSGDIIGKSFLKEGERRFPKLKELKKCLNNIEVPFSYEKLSKRIQDSLIDVNYNEAN